MNRLFILFLLGFSLCVSAQKKEELQRQRTLLEKEINEINTNLSKQKNEAKLSIAYITAVDQKIGIREKIYNTTVKEKTAIEDEIYLRQLEINRQQRELENLRTNYAKVLITAYKNRGIQNKLIFILSSKNLGQAIRRIEYLRKYSEFQDKKVAQITEAAKNLGIAISLKKSSIQEKDKNLISQKVDLQKIQIEKQQKEVLLQDFKKNEVQLTAQLAKKQNEAQQLKNQIASIIREELRLAKQREAAIKKAEAEKLRAATLAAEKEKQRIAAENKARADLLEKQRKEAELAAKRAADLAAKKAEEEKKKASEASAREVEIAKNNARIAEEKAAAARAAQNAQAKKEEQQKVDAEKKVMTNYGVGSSNPGSSFAQNRGKIGFPTDGGTITHRFGRQQHPVFKNIVEENFGIKIAVSAGGRAKAVFPGIVSSIMPSADGTRTVIVKHGEYFSIYSNLSSSAIKLNQAVSAGTIIGTAAQDFDGSYTLDFQIWSGTTPVDPMGWISY